VGVVLGVDGGNSKTELVAATTDGAILALVRGPGTNSHGIGAAGVGRVIASLLAEAALAEPAGHGVFFLCGADVAADIAALETVVRSHGFARQVIVDNDTFALLRAGTDRADAVAVICGAGINCVGRSSERGTARYPALGWETGDWGGAEPLGREALHLAARAEDGRGQQTALVELVKEHFAAPTVESVGVEVHYRRLPQPRLGELAPLVVAAAAAGDAVARTLVERLATEIGLLVARAFRDLGVAAADVVLGGGMLQQGEGLLHELVLERLPGGATPIVLRESPVLGAGLAALDAAGASREAKERLRRELHGR
jgi:N-acetylglucosamine kinase-like BadF-type ATPase